jgi:CRP-like cAMP-binding protein
MNKSNASFASRALDIEVFVLKNIIPDEAIQAGRRLAKLNSFETGESIKNKLTGHVGYVASGAVSTGAAGLSMATTFLPGSWIGLNNCIKGGRSDADIRCISDVDIVFIPIATIFGLPITYLNEMANKIGKLMLIESERASYRLSCKCLLAAELQVAAYLASVVRFHPLLEHVDMIELPLSQHTLSEITGVARTNVSSVIMQLSDAGLLRNAYRVIQLCDLKVWANIANVLIRGEVSSIKDFKLMKRNVLSESNNGDHGRKFVVNLADQ